MAKKETLRCDFCGRSQREVDLLIPGLNGYICNECASRANELAHEYLDKMDAMSVGELDFRELLRLRSILTSM